MFPCPGSPPTSTACPPTSTRSARPSSGSASRSRTSTAVPATGLRGPLVAGRVEIEELTGLKKPIRWCQVDTGSSNGVEGPRGVICGARNFAVGDLVVVACPARCFPRFTISARKTYGHVSDGMIASARELGIGADHARHPGVPAGRCGPR